MTRNTHPARASCDFMILDSTGGGGATFYPTGNGGNSTTDTDSIVNPNGAIVYGYTILGQNGTGEKLLNFYAHGTTNNLIPESGIKAGDEDITQIGRHVSFGDQGIFIPAFGIRIQANNGIAIFFFDAL